LRSWTRRERLISSISAMVMLTIRRPVVSDAMALTRPSCFCTFAWSSAWANPARKTHRTARKRVNFIAGHLTLREILTPNRGAGGRILAGGVVLTFWRHLRTEEPDGTFFSFPTSRGPQFAWATCRPHV